MTPAATVPPPPATPLTAPPSPVSIYNVIRPPVKQEADQIVVYGHSSLLYWWPVWLMSFILAGITYAEGDRAAGVTVSNTNSLGVVFVITLLAVAVSSTVLLRGMMSVVAAVSVVAVGV